MIVKEFNIDKGLYVFDFDELETEFHSHPALEILIANEGTFNLDIDNNSFQDLKFAIINSNIKHRVYSKNCKLKTIMIEYYNYLLFDLLISSKYNMQSYLYFKNENEELVMKIDEICQIIKIQKLNYCFDPRISKAIEHLKHNNLDYTLMMDTLKKITNLSDSRLSHLFSKNVGISLKKYLVWSKLRMTINLHLNDSENLLNSLLEKGFYDQPHFIRNFKNMLGVNPSKAYNSRTIQL